MTTSGVESDIASAIPVMTLVAAGPDVTVTTPALPQARGIALGRVHGTLLMTHQDVAEPVLIVIESIVKCHYLTSGITEYSVDSLGQKRAAHGLGSFYLFTHVNNLPIGYFYSFDYSMRTPPLSAEVTIAA